MGRAVAIACAVGIGAAVSSFVAYAIYFDRKRRRDADFRASLVREENQRSKTTEVAQPVEDEAVEDILNESDPYAALVDGISRDIDLPIEQIATRSMEERQKIFQDLLVFGETFVNVAGNETAISRGIDYLYKALNLVPNPSQLLDLFQKALPKEAFNALMLRIREISEGKIQSYFSSLLPSSNSVVAFKKDKLASKDPATPPHYSYVLVATQPCQKGTVLFTEDFSSYVFSSPQLHELHSSGKKSCCCEYCGVDLEAEAQSAISCLHCLSRFCSSECRERSVESYHENFCHDNPAYQKLINFILNKSKNVTSLLIVRFLAYMLHREATHQVPTPFVNFDFYRTIPVTTVQPTEEDQEELELVLQVLSQINSGMKEFLDIERYLTMRNTIRFNSFAVATGSKPANGSNAIIQGRRSSGLGVNTRENRLYLLTIAAHLNHSSQPNAIIKCSSAPNHPLSIQLVAKRDIRPGEEILVSYIAMHESKKDLAEKFLLLQ